jgi:hypothetical protein
MVVTIREDVDFIPGIKDIKHRVFHNKMVFSSVNFVRSIGITVDKHRENGKAEQRCKDEKHDDEKESVACLAST